MQVGVDKSLEDIRQNQESGQEMKLQPDQTISGSSQGSPLGIDHAI
jgi:hypothetical protein